jgi:hypothetical protein
MGVEPINRAYETRGITGRTPHCLVEDDGIEPSLPAYQTGVLPLDESSVLLESVGGNTRGVRLCKRSGRRGRGRTYDFCFVRAALVPLSYAPMMLEAALKRRTLELVVEKIGFEPITFALQKRCSPVELQSHVETGTTFSGSSTT